MHAVYYQTYFNICLQCFTENRPENTSLETEKETLKEISKR